MRENPEKLPKSSFAQSKATHPKLATSVSLLLKLELILLAGIFIYGPYLLVQRIELFPPVMMPLTELDKSIPFNDNFIWVYNTLFLLGASVALQLSEIKALLRFAGGTVLISIMAFLTFLLFPTETPRPPSHGTSHFYQWFISWDRATNAFPSLHIALATFICRTLIHERNIQRYTIVICIGWAALIVYSTLATKQHVVVDVIGGFFLGAWLYSVNARYLEAIYARIEQYGRR